MKLEINSIDELIQAYKDDKLTDRQLLKVLQVNKKIMVFSDYEETITKAENLESLENYKKYLASGGEFPLIWPFITEDPTKFSLIDATNSKAWSEC